MNSQDIELNDSMHLGSHTIVRGHNLTINTQLSNIGTGGFNGTVQAVLININTGTSYIVQALTGQSIAVYNTHNFTFTSSSILAPSGTYVLTIQHQPGGSGTPIITGSDYYENPIIFNIVAGVEVNTLSKEADNVSIYPNPTDDVLNIDLKGASVQQIRIADIQGREIKTLAPGNNQSIITLPVSDFIPGVYFVQLISGADVVTKKVIIK